MAVKKVQEITYKKVDILQSDTFKRVERDFLSVYLEDGKEYTIEQARKILNDKLKGVVK